MASTDGEISVVAQPHYDRPGKPKRGTPTYRGQAQLCLNPDIVAEHQRRAGRFILATNELVSDALSATEASQEYKEQQGSERGFRFLKAPLFLTSSVFLKSPEPIMAMGLMMGLCLLVYNLGQWQLRQALKQAEQTLPNQLSKGIPNPTLRWIFQCFMAVHYVGLHGRSQIVNLNDVRVALPEANRRRILQFLLPPCRRYYLLC